MMNEACYKKKKSIGRMCKRRGRGGLEKLLNRRQGVRKWDEGGQNEKCENYNKRRVEWLREGKDGKRGGEKKERERKTRDRDRQKDKKERDPAERRMN